MGDDYLDDKIGQYERKLKQAEKAKDGEAVWTTAPMSMVFSLFSKLQLRCVVVIAGDGRAAGILERVHLMQLSVDHLERLARAAGEHDSVRRLPGTTEGSLRDLELRAAILGYGPDAGDDSPLPLVQPRAVAMRTRSL